MHRDAILRDLSAGPMTAVQIFNRLDDCESLPDLMRELRAMVELRDIETHRLGTMIKYRLAGTDADAAPVALPPPQVAVKPEPEAPAEPRRRSKRSGTGTPRPTARRKKQDDSISGRLRNAIDLHPWKTCIELAELAGVAWRNMTPPSVRIASLLTQMVKYGHVQRVKGESGYRYALPGCTVSPPAAAPPSRTQVRAIAANQPPRATPGIRNTLEGMLVELNRQGEVRLTSSGHARLNWMCWITAPSGVMVSSAWRNCPREATVDLLQRLESLRRQPPAAAESTTHDQAAA